MNRFDSRRPDEGLGIFIPRVEEGGKGCLKIGDAEKDAALNGFVVEVAEPPLDEIHPTGTGGNEVGNETRMALQPGCHLFVLVGTVVVHYQMQRHIAGELFVQQAQEFQKLLMSVSLMAFTDNFTL